MLTKVALLYDLHTMLQLYPLLEDEQRSKCGGVLAVVITHFDHQHFMFQG